MINGKEKGRILAVGSMRVGYAPQPQGWPLTSDGGAPKSDSPQVHEPALAPNTDKDQNNG